MKKIFVLLLASLIVMLTMPLMFTSAVSAKECCCECYGTIEDPFAQTCGMVEYIWHPEVVCLDYCRDRGYLDSQVVDTGCVCIEGECVPEASTVVLFATGLLCLAGYVRLKRRKTK